jgi:hypothetical protein
MSELAQVLNRSDNRPAFVRFERVPMEDKAGTLKAGHYVAKDVDFALITPPYSKDVYKTKVDQWFKNLDQDAAMERIPLQWVEHYKQSYRHWKNGQEIPLTGTAIKGWGVISPAQQEMLIKVNILTVEDLAAANDEGLRAIGMGSIDLKNKASAWLTQLQDKGPLTIEVAALKNQNAQLQSTVESLTTKVEELSAALALNKNQNVAPSPAPAATGITADDILDTPEPVARKGGKFAKQGT